ncbi:Orn/DAP/Arg decarboxylase 2, partial [Piptocephalis cylindrospora]
VKCNSDPILLDELVRFKHEGEGPWIGFDCASKEEIRTILETGTSPDQIIFANPIKQPDHIRYADVQGVELMTLDSLEEIDKISNVYPQAKVLLRVQVKGAHSAGNMDKKTGVDEEECPELMARIHQKRMNLAG